MELLLKQMCNTIILMECKKWYSDNLTIENRHKEHSENHPQNLGTCQSE